MKIEIWIAFVSAVLTLMSTPGPSQLLMLSNSVNHGFRRSMYTGAGDLTANLLQMAVASLGLASLIQSSMRFFMVVKWVGVAYLVYLGMKMILSNNSTDKKDMREERSLTSLYLQGFLTSAANPKAVIFFAALFPQFINPSLPLAAQFVMLSATYLSIDAIFLFTYGKSAHWISTKMNSKHRQRANRISGVLLIVAAVLLGLKDVDANK